MRLKQYSRELDHIIASIGHMRDGKGTLARKHFKVAAKSRKISSLLSILSRANQAALASSKRRVTSDDEMEFYDDGTMDYDEDPMDMASDDEMEFYDDGTMDYDEDPMDRTSSITASTKRRMIKAQKNSRTLRRQRQSS